MRRMLTPANLSTLSWGIQSVTPSQCQVINMIGARLSPWNCDWFWLFQSVHLWAETILIVIRQTVKNLCETCIVIVKPSFSQSHRRLYTWWQIAKYDDERQAVSFSVCSYWDMAYDADVMDNRVGLNLLYAQVRGFITLVKPDAVVLFSAATAVLKNKKTKTPSKLN